MKVAFLAIDLRENNRSYSEVTPRFPGGIASLFDGFARLPEVEVHVISCLQQPLQSPEKLADNLWYHALPVPKIGWLRTGYQGLHPRRPEKAARDSTGHCAWIGDGAGMRHQRLVFGLSQCRDHSGEHGRAGALESAAHRELWLADGAV
jgi:hypothetical protein